MCDCFVALPESTADGSLLFAKNSDRAVNEPQYFVQVPARDHGPGSRLQCTYISIPQATHTYGTILSKPSWIWGAEMGVNEFGVCIGNEAIATKLVEREPALLGMDLVRLGLERGTTAGEALEIMTALLAQYKQGGNCSFDGEFYYDNSFLIADSREAWLLETAGAYWAAKKIHSSCSISNYMCIGTPERMHPSAADYARERCWEGAEAFDFTKAYIDWAAPANYNGMVRQNSSRRRLEENQGRMTPEQAIDILRSHTTEEPWLSGNFSVCKHAVSFDWPHQTTGSLVVSLQPEGAALWGTGMSIPCIAPFKPFWFDAYSHAVVFGEDRQEEAMAYWLKREKLNRAMTGGRIDETLYKAELHQMQQQWFALAGNIGIEDRLTFCRQTAGQEEAFIEKWLQIAEAAPPAAAGSAAYQKFWEEKNAQLGKDRRIVFSGTI